MLQAKTKEQKQHIKEILKSTSIHIANDNECGVYIDDWIYYDEMAEIVDYLRGHNKQQF